MADGLPGGKACNLLGVRKGLPVLLPERQGLSLTIVLIDDVTMPWGRGMGMTGGIDVTLLVHGYLVVALVRI
ncbi:hypothetical protein GCM10011408_41270 [Dyella caseinilytica]|nr:hypothetical protein GCM10011408_41270 [Dyella caseinilytica]